MNRISSWIPKWWFEVIVNGALYLTSKRPFNILFWQANNAGVAQG